MIPKKYILILLATFSLLPITSQAAGKQFTVVLDAGHGGKDPGALGSTSSSKEKNINLNIVLEIGRLLQNNCPDVKVLYTRKQDVFVALDRRAEIANKAKADLFVSVHVNALPKNAKKVTGVQSYTLTLKSAETNLEVEKAENSVIQYEENGNSKYSFAGRSPESDIMFELMQDRDMKESVAFAEIVQKEMVNTAGRHNMGVLQANLAVLRLTYMPSVLLEVGYISTPSEEQYLNTTYGQSSLAKSIYNAISRYKAKQTGKMSALEKVDKPATQKPEEVKPAEESKTADSIQQKAEQKVDQKPQQAEEQQPADPQPEAKAYYRVQILSGDRILKDNDPQLKGLKADHRKEGKIYKYTYGKASTLSEAKQLRKSILDKFPEAFIVNY